MCVTITRFSGLSAVTRGSRIAFQASRVSFSGMPVSTIVHPSPSSISQTLMNFREKGSDMRIHWMRGVISIICP